jgi:hypothetical protein
MNKSFEIPVGTRIKVTGYINDPRPPAIGDTGTVARISGQGTAYEQVTVKWDNNRSLMLVPEDYGSVARA